MARKTQISKEIILDAAFVMLIRDGYAAINITSLSKSIGCSTQPIAWHFGNMDTLRAELLEHCLLFLKDHFVIEEKSVADSLEEIAIRYIELALDYPNLYKYLYMSEQEGKKMLTIAEDLRALSHEKVVHMLKEEHGLEKEKAETYLLNMQFYVHGIASFAGTEILFSTKEGIIQMVRNASRAFLKDLKQEQESE